MKLWQKLLIATLAVWGVFGFFASDGKGWSLFVLGCVGLFSIVVAIVLAVHWWASTRKEQS